MVIALTPSRQKDFEDLWYQTLRLAYRRVEREAEQARSVALRVAEATESFDSSFYMSDFSLDALYQVRVAEQRRQDAVDMVAETMHCLGYTTKDVESFIKGIPARMKLNTSRKTTFFDSYIAKVANEQPAAK